MHRPPSLLYHYCDPDAFLGMISGRSIWACDPMAMNDNAEMRWADRYLDDLVRIANEHSPRAGKLIRMIWSLEKKPYFITCFSAEADKLSQWRGYAKDCLGFCVGIDPGDLLGINTTDPLDLPQGGIALSKVYYTEEDQRAFINYFIPRVISRWSQDTKTIDGNEVDGMAAGLSIMDFLKVIFKNPCFSEEREYRLIFNPVVIPALNQPEYTGLFSTLHKGMSMSYRSSSRGITPHFSVPIMKTCQPDERTIGHKSSAISEVILGPKNANTVDEIIQMLNAYGFSGVKVTRSPATYR